MSVTDRDKSVLRGLAAQLAEAAALPINQERIEGWKRINGLGKGKAMIWINEIPWHEMSVNDELTLQSEDPFCRAHELRMRRTIYQWKHMPGDMVVEPVYYSPLVIHDTGLGITEDVDVARTDEASGVVSRHFHLQITEPEDAAKIKMPRVTYDAEATERNYQTLVDAFGDILPVEKRGAPGFWFAPWDNLIRWWGVTEAMMDLVIRPEMVHQVMDRLVSAYVHRLDQYDALNLLALNNDNTRIGSGGYGYIDELPQDDYDPARPRTCDLWGCGTAQIFSDVSPAMHEEFALQYERRWMKRFGLTYYGCCEPLDIKLDILRKGVPNLRKISMSPWIKLDRAVENVGNEFVFSRKPNPAVFAEDGWSPQRARDELVEVLERTRDVCSVELIMKDISTVRYHPERLWEWAEIARQVTEEYA